MLGSYNVNVQSKNDKICKQKLSKYALNVLKELY